MPGPSPPNRVDSGFVRAAVDQFERPLTLYAAKLLGNVVAARVVAQDTFLRLKDTTDLIGLMTENGMDATAAKRFAEAAALLLPEFASLGLLAGFVASISASVIASLISEQVFNLPWSFNFPLIAYGVLGGSSLALLAGLWATRKVTQVPPMETLRAL